MNRIRATEYVCKGNGSSYTDGQGNGGVKNGIFMDVLCG